jgi:nicotinamide riboside transporter PnuC
MRGQGYTGGDHEGIMFPFTTIIEWGATLLSLYGFWLCVRHRAVCFVVFLIADAGWFVSAWVNAHPALLAQQAVYIVLNVIGYYMWRRDERIHDALERLESRPLVRGRKMADAEADEEPGGLVMVPALTRG